MNSDNLVSIGTILEGAGEFSGWLYLPPQPWTVKTKGVFSPYGKNADSKSIPDSAKQDGWSVTLSSDMIQDIVENVNDQFENPSIVKLFEAFVFYFQNDAFVVL